MPRKISTAADQIYSALLDDIVSGNLPAGAPLLLKTIARRFDVSLMPVRDALQQLEASKVVERKQSRRLEVKKLSIDDYQEIMELRIILESHAIRKATENFSSEVLKEIQDLEATMKITQDMQQFIKFNRDFHHILYRRANAPILYQIIDALWLRLSPYLQFYAHTERTHITADKYHAKLVKAYRAKDADVACDSLARDLQAAAESVVKTLKKAV